MTVKSSLTQAGKARCESATTAIAVNEAKASQSEGLTDELRLCIPWANGGKDRRRFLRVFCPDLMLFALRSGHFYPRGQKKKRRKRNEKANLCIGARNHYGAFSLLL